MPLLGPLLLQFGIPLAITFWVGRKLNRRIAGYRAPWKGVAAIIWAVGLLILLGFLGILVQFTMHSGGWRCVVCDKPAFKVYFLGLLIGNDEGSPGSAYYRESDAAYERWHGENVGLPHEHDWTTVGCHHEYLAISCSLEGFCAPWYSTIPRLPDRDLAVALVKKLVAADPQRRWKMLRAFCHPSYAFHFQIAGRTEAELKPLQERIRREEVGPFRPLAELDKLSAADRELAIERIAVGEPWVAPKDGHAVSPEEFRKLYELWLRFSPEWQ